MSQWHPFFLFSYIINSFFLKRYRQGKECVHMNLNNQQDNTWSPNQMSQYINVKMSIYTPEVWTKWVELQLNGEYIYIWLKRILMTNSKFLWWNGGETETSHRASYWRNSEPVSNCTLQHSLDILFLSCLPHQVTTEVSYGLSVVS